MDHESWLCPECAEERDFLQPPCTDGHDEAGEPCPDWACADCGYALTVGGWSAARPVLQRAAA